MEQNHKWESWGERGFLTTVLIWSFQNTLGKMALSTPIGLEKQIGPQVGQKGCQLVGWADCPRPPSPGSKLGLTGPRGLTASLETPHSSAEVLGPRCRLLCESSRGSRKHRGRGARREAGRGAYLTQMGLSNVSVWDWATDKSRHNISQGRVSGSVEFLMM